MTGGSGRKAFTELMVTIVPRPAASIDGSAARRYPGGAFIDPPPSMEVGEAAREELAQRTPAYAGFINGYDHREELDAALAQVKTPTTIIWGEQDRLLPIICAHDLQRGIPNSELVLLPRVGHMPQIQAPTQVARLILSSSAS